MSQYQPVAQAPAEDHVVAIATARPAGTFERPSPEQQTRVKLGRIVAASGVKDAVALPRITECLLAHARGEWGCVCEQDQRTNEEALKRGFRVHSAWPIDPAQPSEGHGANTLWIITDWDRSITTVLLPEEY